MTWRRRKTTIGEAEAPNREAAHEPLPRKTPFLPNDFKEEDAVAVEQIKKSAAPGPRREAALTAERDQARRLRPNPRAPARRGRKRMAPPAPGRARLVPARGRVPGVAWRAGRHAHLAPEESSAHGDRSRPALPADVPADWRASMQMAGMPIPDRKTRERVEEEYRMLMARLLPGEETMDKVLRYESRLHRYLLQMLYMIMVLKGLIPAGTGRLYGVATLKQPGGSRRTGPPEPPGAQGRIALSFPSPRVARTVRPE